MKTLRKGFTIVELVIVIAVIAILAGVLIPTFSGVVGKANQSALQQEFTNTLKVVLAGNAESGALAPDTRFVTSNNGKPTAYCDYNGNKLQTIVSIANNATLTNLGYKGLDLSSADVPANAIKFTQVIIGYDNDAPDAAAIKIIASIFGAKTAQYNKADGTVEFTVEEGTAPSALSAYTNSDLSKGTFVLVP